MRYNVHLTQTKFPYLMKASSLLGTHGILDAAKRAELLLRILGDISCADISSASKRPICCCNDPFITSNSAQRRASGVAN